MKHYLASDGLTNNGWSLYVENDLLANYKLTWGDQPQVRTEVEAIMPDGEGEGWGERPARATALLQVNKEDVRLCDVERPHFAMRPTGYELHLTEEALLQASRDGLFTLAHSFGLQGAGRVGFDGLIYEQVLALEASRAALQTTLRNARGVLFLKNGERQGSVIFLDRVRESTKPIAVSVVNVPVQLHTNELTAIAVTDEILDGLLLKASDVMDLMRQGS